MTKALQQGQADGLCGLYAVLNFLNTTEWKEESPSKGLWYILDACRHFGWFTPQTLTEGYEDFQLKAILDLQFENNRLNFRTAFLSDVGLQLPELSFDEIAQRVIAKRGAIIVQTQRGGHWLLVRGRKSRPFVWDSGSGSAEPKPLASRRVDKELGWGIVILPSQRTLQQVDL